MRYRALDANGDYVVGQQFLINTPAAVAQAVMTRLRLWKGEFFANTADGTAWLTDVLGPRPGKNPDDVIKARILGTTGMVGITGYSSSFEGTNRKLTVSATLTTLYGVTTISGALT